MYTRATAQSKLPELAGGILSSWHMVKNINFSVSSPLILFYLFFTFFRLQQTTTNKKHSKWFGWTHSYHLFTNIPSPVLVQISPFTLRRARTLCHIFYRAFGPWFSDPDKPIQWFLLMAMFIVIEKILYLQIVIWHFVPANSCVGETALVVLATQQKRTTTHMYFSKVLF